MKYILLLVSLVSFYNSQSQTTAGSAEAKQVLSKVGQKLNSLQHVSYHYTRETKYFADNYYNKTAVDMYIEFTAASPTGLRYQSQNGTREFIYNGQSVLRIDKKEMMIDTAAARTSRSMDNNSDLYHSFAMIRNIIPLVLNNDSIQKSVADTMIDGKQYACVKIEGPNMYFGLFDGIQQLTIAGLRRPYYLVVDKKTMLPYQFSTKFIRGEDARDFATIVFTHVNTHPVAPPATSWHYEAYANVYKYLPAVVRKPVIRAGGTVADFELPLYTPAALGKLSLKKYAGKVVLLDFWFKSCGPCMAAMPKYKTLQSKFEKQGFNLLTVNIEDPVDDIRFFYNKHKPNYPMLFNGKKVFDDLGLTACPSSILIGKDGKVAAVYIGFDAYKIEKKIEELVAL